MSCQEHLQHPANFLALTSLTPLEFEYLLGQFTPQWQAYYKHHTLEGKKPTLPAFSEHGNALLRDTDQKLFFLLVYMKNNPLQTFQAAGLGLSQAKVSKIYRALLAVPDQTLLRLKLAPSGIQKPSKPCSRRWLTGSSGSMALKGPFPVTPIRPLSKKSLAASSVVIGSRT